MFVESEIESLEGVDKLQKLQLKVLLAKVATVCVCLLTFAFAEWESYWTNDYRRLEWSGVEFHFCNRLLLLLTLQFQVVTIKYTAFADLKVDL